MTTLTKTEAEAILERLADKTLSFGTLVKINEPVLENLRKKDRRAGFAKNLWIVSDVEADCARLKNFYDTELDIGSWLGSGLFEVLGHPILIGDVLEKIQTIDHKKAVATLRNCKVEDVHGDCDIISPALLLYWQPLGFTKNLQEIYNRIEWEEPAPRCSFEATANHYDKSKWLAKPSPFADLYIFLKEIGL